MLIVGVSPFGFGGIQRYSQDLQKALPNAKLIDSKNINFSNFAELLRNRVIIATHWRCLKIFPLLSKKNVSIIFHGTDIHSCPPKLMEIIGSSDAITNVIVPSKYTKSLLQTYVRENNIDFNENKIAIINHGSSCKPNTFHCERTPSTPLRILSLLRMEYSEKFTSLIKFINNWENSIDFQAHFTLIGTGPGLERVRNFFHTKGLSNVSVISGENFIGDDYKNYDLFALPNMSEGFGYAVLDSLLHGVPVVVDRNSGTSEFCTAKNSLHFDTKKNHIFFDENQIQRLIQHPPDQIAKTVKNFSLENMGRNYCELFSA